MRQIISIYFQATYIGADKNVEWRKMFGSQILA